MALSKHDEAKVDTYDFHAPRPAYLFEPSKIGVISIFRYGRNAAEDGLKYLGTNFKVRFERAQTDEAVEVAKRIVKALNAGTYQGSNVTCVPTGRPRGRRPVAA